MIDGGSMFPLDLLVTGVIIPTIATLVAWYVKQILDYVSKKKRAASLFCVA